MKSRVSDRQFWEIEQKIKKCPLSPPATAVVRPQFRSTLPSHFTGNGVYTCSETASNLLSGLNIDCACKATVTLVPGNHSRRHAFANKNLENEFRAHGTINLRLMLYSRAK